MAICVREADLEKDAGEVVRFLTAYLDESADRSRYDWLYRQGPFGKGRAWLAEEEGALVGVAGAFPRLTTEGKAWVLGDFCIHPKQRSLGAAVALQKASLAALADGGSSPWFDFPSRSMMAVHKRLKCEPNAEFVRMVRMLRSEAVVNSRIQNRTAAKVAALAINAGLRLANLGSGAAAKSYEVQISGASFGREFDDLCKSSAAVKVQRTSDYLAWRFERHPQRRYELARAKREERMAAFVVFTCEPDAISLVDLGGDDFEAVGAIVGRLVQLGFERSVQRLQVGILKASPMFDAFRRLRFQPRESVPVIIQDGRAAEWVLYDGDRES